MFPAQYSSGTGFPRLPVRNRSFRCTVIGKSTHVAPVGPLEKLNALQGLSYAAKLQGDLKTAEADSRAALGVGSEMGPQKTYPVLLDLADILAAEGRIADSRAMAERALDESGKVNDRESIAISEAALAQALALGGMLPDAIAKYSEAIRILRELHIRWELGMTLLDFGDAQLQEGDLAGARKSFEEVRDLGRKTPGDFSQPEIALAFARLSMAAGQTQDAAGFARTAMDKFAAAGREGDRLEAAALLARALIARGSISEATAVLDQLPSPERKTFPIEAVVQYRLARCLIEANNGRRAEAGRAMAVIAAEVARLGLPPLEKETRIAREAVMETASRH